MKTVHVLNLGGGVQSTTLHLLSEYGLTLPRFDYAILADTGDEPRAVYRHLTWLAGQTKRAQLLIRSADPRRNAILQRLTPLQGGPKVSQLGRVLLWLRRMKQGSLRGSLEKGVNSTGQRFAAIPAFIWDGKTFRGNGTRREGRMLRQCTAEWKINVVERAIRREILGLRPRQRMPKDVRIVQTFGLSAEELGRVFRVKQRYAEIPWATVHFPLVAMNWTRQDCLRWLATQNIPHQVPRSACIHCPFHNDPAWLALQAESPQEWEEACALDERLRQPGVVASRNLVGQLYLHRSCQPLRSVRFEQQPQPAGHFSEECLGMCGQ